MNLREYINKKRENGGEYEQNQQNPTQNNYNQPEANKASQPMNTDEINQAYQKYGSMSEENLMQELFKVANESRENGNLNNEELENFYSQSQSFLTPEQRERMKELIGMLKN